MGATVIVPEADGTIFVGVPGYGFMRQNMMPANRGGGGGCSFPPCETEGPGGAGGESARAIVLGDQTDFPLELRLPQPNPSRGLSVVSWSIPRAQEGVRFELALFDIAGRRAATLAEGIARAGRFDREVSFSSDQGMAQRSGVYFVRLRVGSQVLRRTVVLAR